jgi:zinc transporter ZupT
LAFSAGALIYVGATHLLPRAEREPRRFSLVALAAGILVAVGIVLGAG